MKAVRRGCAKKQVKQAEALRYEGTIEFRGEEGFAEATATSAPLDYPTLCVGVESVPGGRNQVLPGARLDVEKSHRSKRRIEFDATQRRPGAGIAVSVEVEEYRREMVIYRVTGTWAPPGALRYGPRLRTATVKPPAPFSGHGTYRRNARRANQWTGNLSVDLSGRSDVRLTGRSFVASLEHPRR